MAPTRVIVDTDPGIDDTAAIFFALASSAEIQIECFTTVFGNCSVEQATRNCLAILDVAGRADLPVYRGAGRPLLRDPRYAPHIHGDDGLGGHAASYPASRDASPRGAVEQLVERVMAAPGEITFNVGAERVTLSVANTGDRPIQVGSHYHFAETNPALRFERERARGMRLDIAPGTAVRFEPGATREVTLVPFSGRREIYGFRQAVMGPLETAR